MFVILISSMFVFYSEGIVVLVSSVSLLLPGTAQVVTL